jgi:hypothetical protein
MNLKRSLTDSDTGWRGNEMEKLMARQTGIETLLWRHKRSFRIPENINYYSEEDFRAAEKKYIKLCMTRGGCNLSPQASNGLRRSNRAHIS